MKVPKELQERLEFTPDKSYENSPPLLKKIIHKPQPCEDCGQLVCDRQQQFRLHSGLKFHAHWRVTCRTCNLVCNPRTGKYDLTPLQAQSVFFEMHSKKTK